MKANEMKKELPDLKPYQLFGIPILKFMGGLVLISLIVIAIYEFIF